MIAADCEDISNNKSSSNGDNQEKRTVGEELFLVHLNRASAVEPDPTDFDRETKAKEGAVSSTATKAKPKAKQKGAKESNDEDSPTPGEELWKVHCKRFKGSEDGEDDDEVIGKLKGDKGARGLIGGGGGSVAHDDGRVLHLRNRDVAIH